MASKTATPPIKGVKANSRVKEIGSVYRRRGGSDWRINIKLDPGQGKKNFSISQLALMPRRRVLNATEHFKPAGYPWTIHIEDATAWSHRRIRECPIRNVSEQEDRDQWCFSFESDGIEFFLPQIELARVLFFHYAYMARLAMIPNGLNEEFDIQPGDDPDKTEIHILPTSTLPLKARGNNEQRRLLAWVLLDEEARRSFSSIAQHQLREGKERNGHRVWKFRFDPPALPNVELSVRGQFHKESQVFFVYEVYSAENLSTRSSKVVEFFDPRFAEPQAGKGGGVQKAIVPPNQALINDDELPTVDSEEHILDVPPVTLSFSRPVMTTRKASSGRRRSGTGEELEEDSETDDGQTEVSTDEPTIRGQLPAAGFNAIDDQSDDLHLYAHKFEAFAAVVELLKIKGCRQVFGGVRKLPALSGYSKHLLKDGNPRCISFNLLNKNGKLYALLEVDTSDYKNRLSTLLLKQPNRDFDWQAALDTLEQRLLQNSLNWPTPYINLVFPGHQKRIQHPRTPSGSRAFIEASSLQHWADRIDLAME
ncbi:Tn7-like element transposition protein TnsE [Marinobacter sp.]|jgi:T7 transposase TnsE-like protein|uniref:Tn7-like element transposition protein TnsE n=1 Tax=Marinobacter sp. TaxID=50741 RepID=UPI003B523A82